MEEGQIPQEYTEQLQQLQSQPQAVPSSDNIGYHAGDLGKAEHFGMQYGSKRGTGHFGTGTYFVGDKSKITKGAYKNRPVQTINFDKYNLYKPKNSLQAEQAHDSLKYINTYYEDSKKSIVNDDYIDMLKMEEPDVVIKELKK